MKGNMAKRKKRRKKRRGRRGRRTGYMERIGSERIELLFREAVKRAREGDMELAVSYLQRAKRIGMRLNLRTLNRYNGEYCKACMVPFATSSYFRVRLRDGKKVTTCLRCGEVYRMPYDGDRDGT